MVDADNVVIAVDYRDSHGRRSQRVISPVRWLRDGQAFTALCLGREECRTFRLDRCLAVELVASATVLMPAPISEEAAKAETIANDSG